MVIIICVWAFAFLCLFGTGRAVLAAFRCDDGLGLNGAHPFLVCMAGLLAVTAFANCWAFVAPVGRAADLCVLAVSIGVLLYQQRSVAAYCRHWARRARCAGWPVWLAVAALLLIALVKSAGPSELKDEGGYYLPYIRWIEQYRIIPGLANIEHRFGFNSAFHIDSAFFGLSWLVPGGAYDLNGLLLLLFGTWCMGALGRLLKPGLPRISDVMKLFCMFFLMRNMLTSSAADFSNMILGETVLILFMEKIEDRTTARFDLHFVLILACSILVATIKLSSLFLFLVPAWLALRILSSRNRLPIAGLSLLLALGVLPWLARFPVLTGYPVYPLYQLDLLHVDWKVPKDVVKREYHYVGEFAKTNAKAGDSIRLAEERGPMQWIPEWFARENPYNRTMALAMLASLLGLLIFALSRMRRLLAHDKDLLAFGVIVAANAVLWFLRNPAFRFGWAWGIILVALAFRSALKTLHTERLLRWGTVALLALFTLQNTAKTIMENKGDLLATLVRPCPPHVAATRSAMLGPLQVRIAESGPCWGALPPCLPARHNAHLQARGPRVEDGFRTARPNE